MTTNLTAIASIDLETVTGGRAYDTRTSPLFPSRTGQPGNDPFQGKTAGGQVGSGKWGLGGSSPIGDALKTISAPEPTPPVLGR